MYIWYGMGVKLVRLRCTSGTVDNFLEPIPKALQKVYKRYGLSVELEADKYT